MLNKLAIKTRERGLWRRSGVFIVNFEHISHLFLVFPFLTLNKSMLAGLLPFTNTVHARMRRDETRRDASNRRDRFWFIWFDGFMLFYADWTLYKTCLYSEFFWSVLSRIRTKMRRFTRISLCIQSEYGKTRENSEYGYFSSSRI